MDRRWLPLRNTLDANLKTQDRQPYTRRVLTDGPNDVYPTVDDSSEPLTKPPINRFVGNLSTGIGQGELGRGRSPSWRFLLPNKRLGSRGRLAAPNQIEDVNGNFGLHLQESVLGSPPPPPPPLSLNNSVKRIPPYCKCQKAADYYTITLLFEKIP